MSELKNLHDSTNPADTLAEPPALPGRWTICAMLFMATTINYVDRQVLSILKPVLAGSTLHLEPFFHGWPTVEASIRLNEIQYGYIVDCFQVAYALGVVFAGRLVDRLGCRRGYPLITGIWSLAAMGHALVQFGLRISAWRVSSWGWVRAAIFPRQSRPQPNGFRRKSEPLPRESSTPARVWAPSLRRSSFRGWRCTSDGALPFSSQELSAQSGSSGGR